MNKTKPPVLNKTPSQRKKIEVIRLTKNSLMTLTTKYISNLFSKDLYIEQPHEIIAVDAILSRYSSDNSLISEIDKTVIRAFCNLNVESRKHYDTVRPIDIFIDDVLVLLGKDSPLDPEFNEEYFIS